MAAIIVEIIRAARAGRQASAPLLRPAPSLPARPKPDRGERPPPMVDDSTRSVTWAGHATALRAGRKRRRDRDLMDLWHREARLVLLVRQFATAARTAAGREYLPRELRESSCLIRLLELPQDADESLARTSVGKALLFCDTLRKVVDRRGEGYDRVRDLRDLPTLEMLPELTRRILAQARREK
jgi:hypothetical protein